MISLGYIVGDNPAPWYFNGFECSTGVSKLNGVPNYAETPVNVRRSAKANAEGLNRLFPLPPLSRQWVCFPVNGCADGERLESANAYVPTVCASADGNAWRQRLQEYRDHGSGVHHGRVHDRVPSLRGYARVYGAR